MMSTRGETPRPFPVIAGPTAGGKSALAVAVAQVLASKGRPAEVVTADAYQVYRGMDIGTAKPTVEERGGVVHHLVDVADPREPFTLQQWLATAEEVTGALEARGITPVVVGGTHLYIKAFLEGIFEGPEPDQGLREELRAMDPAARRAELERVDPDAAARIHFNDERRTVRALEVFRQTGRPISDHQQQWEGGVVRAGARLVVLEWGTEAINRRINARVREMMEMGLLDEVRGLNAAGALGRQSCEALGYKQLLGHLAGACTLEESVERIKIETRRFAKNQRTWLKRLRMTAGTLTLRPEEMTLEAMTAQVVGVLG
ncbi:MAG: tRNA (adenosine(37)-N6)-dimethylallyltransferase MiaA [Phycisphaerales bacterium]